MRLVTYNIEWFSHLFDKNDQLILDNKPSGRHGVDRYTQGVSLAHVFQTLDADAVMVIEAPNTGRRQRTVRALGAFAAEAGLRANEVISGFATDTHQEIALMYDPAVLSAEHDARSSKEAPRFDTRFELDLDTDSIPEHVRFSKPPLELNVTTAGGKTLRMIGAHLKSKAPYGVKGHDAIIQRAIENRRTQLAQAIWLHRRIADHIAAGDDLILMGDLNDGPGLDEYERLFGQSSVEIIMGQDLTDPHAESLKKPRPGIVPSTARFYDEEKKRFFRACLDYVMISQSLTAYNPRWRIWHPFEDADCYADEVLREALLMASDHFPVSLDIDLT
ncbi:MULTISPECIES: endonuclease/exonuclease/phosphatase family protein [Rhodobacterales]|jgi:endonuclease/exonuclease/phosphatase family metal-dependent hydrolase|uniref:endonuclease/exonuclease/phosphatase family protein n=1 Tax=Rhodobacterales TaxID=204455 RepID=UPI00237F6F42|nr:endonuclease/exonuclease/phosphatase family protein [Phaeobacter gallaeciensis]MDE4142428.1 endonuclease [Phaeobacter gallaeciensis]MDE4150936.1 endonuclease [Phaeobacter gallaeciensis]MDE4155102.1 endonuclease [Phaeobacter gallaeciensis]MDE4230555.1 endonuclease [Phaeobacter gallaeciensis]MDE4259569.1 endonuclease [Phaeobacter gallaeciensis]